MYLSVMHVRTTAVGRERSRTVLRQADPSNVTTSPNGIQASLNSTVAEQRRLVVTEDAGTRLYTRCKWIDANSGFLLVSGPVNATMVLVESATRMSRVETSRSLERICV